jgi:hypothetical protein
MPNIKGAYKHSCYINFYIFKKERERERERKEKERKKRHRGSLDLI